MAGRVPAISFAVAHAALALIVIAGLDPAIHSAAPGNMDHRVKSGGDAFMSDSPATLDPKVVPAEIGRWNWGAFLLNWIWGIGNQTYIALLALIPGFGFIWMLVLGVKGNAWAWRNGRWDSVEHFKRVQRKWAIWGAVIWFVVLVFFGGTIGGVFFALKNSAAYEMAVAKLQANPVATSVLGSPIATGWPTGGINFNGSAGQAALSFSASGPKAASVVFAEAVKKNGVWSLTRLALKLNSNGRVIDLLGGAKPDTT
jgi:Cytochrome oxidase complex assembly protein 1